MWMLFMPSNRAPHHYWPQRPGGSEKNPLCSDPDTKVCSVSLCLCGQFYFAQPQFPPFPQPPTVTRCPGRSGLTAAAWRAVEPQETGIWGAPTTAWPILAMRPRSSLAFASEWWSRYDRAAVGQASTQSAAVVVTAVDRPSLNG